MRGLLFVFVLMMAFPLEEKAQNGGVAFLDIDSWESVLKIAKREQKYIMIDAYTTWCGPCKKMDEEVYIDQKVGEAVNKKFISIKVQMDSTRDDKACIRNWYNDAATLRMANDIRAYPSILFFSPEGQLLIKYVGYKDSEALINIANFVSDPNGASKINDQIAEFEAGNHNYILSPNLSRTVREILKDTKLADKIAEDYKFNYLDTLPPDRLLTRENLHFIRENGDRLLSVEDKIFSECYFHPAKVDSIFGESIADWLVLTAVYKDEINDEIYSPDGHIINPFPDWDKLRSQIKSFYAKLDVMDILLNAKIAFYRRKEDWRHYAKLKDEHIRKHPPKAENMDVFFSLNIPAWDVFLNSDDPAALKQALRWSELSIKLEKNVQYLDTKANLLYKLGRRKQAIVVQSEAIKIDKEEAKRSGQNYNFSYILENLEKMKAGKPTWE